MCTFYLAYFWYLKGILINRPLLVVFFIVLLVGVGMFIFCVLLNIFSLSCLFVTGFLFMISLCSAFTKYNLGC